jgi:hypothetical protein
MAQAVRGGDGKSGRHESMGQSSQQGRHSYMQKESTVTVSEVTLLNAPQNPQYKIWLENYSISTKSFHSGGFECCFVSLEY